MKVCVQLFAAARQRAARPAIELDLPSDATVGLLRKALAEASPELGTILPQCLIAVGMDYADDGVVLSGNPQVACIPPVSGG